ncbi:MAG: hypothetical protein E6R14_01510 [Thermomicrobiales bacterium]|jgi:hypothetical protein|nr:MAG: hypothetical protein E6R14_01510 [Thermomicrobiales bacterium]
MRGVMLPMVLAGAALCASPAVADLYSTEDFRNGVRAYESVYGAYRQRDPQLEGSAFEFLGYVKAIVDAHNGTAFCMRRTFFPRAVAGLVSEYNGHAAMRELEPKAVVLDVFAREYPCILTVREGMVPVRRD